MTATRRARKTPVAPTTIARLTIALSFSSSSLIGLTSMLSQFLGEIVEERFKVSPVTC